MIHPNESADGHIRIGGERENVGVPRGAAHREDVDAAARGDWLMAPRLCKLCRPSDRNVPGCARVACERGLMRSTEGCVVDSLLLHEPRRLATISDPQNGGW